RADVMGDPIAGALELAVSGTARDLRTGIASLDGLLAGEAEISGGVTLGPATIAFDGLTFASAAAAVRANGRLGGGDNRIEAELALTDLGALDPRLSGAATATAVLTGEVEAPSIDFDASLP